MSRYRLHRAGILNVWQYDDQVFELGDGRMLLRGTNGAGKSKTLEMLLPYCLDGDNTRMNASGAANSLMWLMFDGYEDTLRVGYLWVELVLRHDDGRDEHITCGVGLRGSQSAKTVKKWMFTTTRRVGVDLDLEGPDGPLGEGALAEALGADGQVFTAVRDYRAHVGRRLFGLDPTRYDDLLRLLYWLRRPQVGEEIEPRRIAEQLAQSLPEIDAEEVERAGATLDELSEHGERLERAKAARDAVSSALATYRRYARQEVRSRADSLVGAADQERRLARAARTEQSRVERLAAQLDGERAERTVQDECRRAAQAELDALATTPDEARLSDQRELAEQAEKAVARQQGTATTAERAATGAQLSEQRLREVAAEDARSRDDEASSLASAVHQLALLLPTGFAAADAAARAMAGDDPVAAVTAWHDAHDAACRELDTVVTARRAVVEQVRDLAREHDRAGDEAARATTAAEEVAARADQQRARHAKSRTDAVTAAEGWQQQVRDWAGQSAALDLPLVADVLAADAALLAEPDAETELTAQVAVDAAPERERRRTEVTAAQLAHERLREHRATLTAELEAARAERDPAPPKAVLPRARDEKALPGMPFWRAIDFRDDVSETERAALEAALQQAGLLDAWLDPDGSVLGGGHDDVLLVAGPPAAGDSLTRVLRAAEGAPYATAVLAAVALRPDAERGDDLVAVGADGSFRLGALRGRASKPAAQYVGAAAREAERARRIAELTTALERAEAELFDATSALAVAQKVADDLEAWVRAVPSTRPLDRARDTVAAAHDELRRLEGEADQAEQRASALRSRAALAQRALTEAASEHRLSTETAALDEVLANLREVGRGVTDHRNRLGALRNRAGAVAEAVSRTADATATHAEALRVVAELRTQARTARAAYDALAAALSDTLTELAARRTASKQELNAADARVEELTRAVETLTGDLGGAQRQAEQARDLHARHGDVLAGCVDAVAAMRGVRGLLTAAAGTVDEDADRALAARSETELVALARTWTGWAREELDDNVLIRAADELKAGPAASYEPSLVREQDAYAMLAEHQAQTVPLVELDAVLTEKVAQDELLLTERERRTFEEVLLGALGDQLRLRLQESGELVRSMNELLADVRTSQGIRVRLRWRMRDDVPTEAREVATLVARTGAALLPDERERLAVAMSGLVSYAADEAPEDGYQLHLQRALDYRTWHEFRVQYARPGTDWQDLGRRSPLSQGEQKVACYLPLFAAAAAHYTSVAGAAPHAPRFVLLDDAFPKIDARTHPVLFGLLVDLDLDFVVTSERLWGDHPQVPRLEIYEALRSPGEPGIAHAHYTWDGRTLQSVDA
jgi:uncharacterized protein (TIGR02680 family)